jgi:hypothetical protein
MTHMAGNVQRCADHSLVLINKHLTEFRKKNKHFDLKGTIFCLQHQEGETIEDIFCGPMDTSKIDKLAAQFKQDPNRVRMNLDRALSVNGGIVLVCYYEKEANVTHIFILTIKD